MFIVIVHHWCKPGMTERARRRLDGNGEEMARRPGFLWRHRIEAAKEPLKVSTVTAWSSEATYKAWMDYKKALDRKKTPDPELSATVLFERWENQQYEVALSHEPETAA
jgi:heme-degrading monooxygenase HmoA